MKQEIRNEVIYCKLCGGFIPFERRSLPTRQRFFDTNSCCHVYYAEGYK